ncbi:MAG TPA: nucleotide disphospho-sugar-binding domain-containing protein, partial [Rugosimonospora sp.]|nr:nucleotide disphospho-sugar-binding domain-containing protein [Rugosimonospora sp.]
AGSPQIGDCLVQTGLPAVVLGSDPPPLADAANPVVRRVYGHRRFPADWPLRPQDLDEEQRAVVELLGRNCARAGDALADDLIAFAREWRPDLVVHDTGAFAGAVAAAALGIPNVRHLTGVGLRPMERRVARPEPLPEYARLFGRRGIPVRTTPTLTLDPSPPSLRLPVRDPWREVRYVPYNGAAPVPSDVDDDGPPRVCVTWGYSAARAVVQVGAAALDPFQEALAALDALDVRPVIVTTTEQLRLLRGRPGSAEVLAGAPLHLVLPRCAAVLHQCGDGTALTAAASGTPQLAITRKPDPALTADRLANAGAAIHLRYQELPGGVARIGAIREAVEKLLADAAYQQGASRLRAEIERQPPPAALVPVLARLAAAGSA